jgi:hypothetical protein
MSLEKDLSRIAVALERLAAAAEAKGHPVIEVPTAPPSAPPTAPAAPTAPPAPTPPPAQTVELTPEEVNAILVAELGRLGGPDKIYELLNKTYGVASISNIPATQYNAVVAAVKALK